MVPGKDRPDVVPDLLRLRAQRHPTGIATFHRVDGEWIPTTWSALWMDVQRTSAAFRGLGLRRGDRVAILARTCREWQVAEFAALLSGAAVVGLDAHASDEQVAWILGDAQVAAVVADTPQNAARAAAGARSPLKFLVAFDGDPQSPLPVESRAWRDLKSDESAVPAQPMPDSNDIAMLIYTSGTTGTPKGIEYSHRQLMTSCWCTVDEFPDLGESNRVLCWLPMGPLFQRVLNLVAFASRSVTFFVEDPREIMARIAEVRPTTFASVPRFYEKLHDGIQERLAAQAGVRKRLIDAALAAGAEWSRCVRSGSRPSWTLRMRRAFLDALVLRQIRSVMGGQIKWMISGSAAAPVWLLEFFHSIGLLVLEAYGVTENPVPVAANRSHAYRFGSVGRPFRVNDVRIGEDSEVLVKGPAMFNGYRGDDRHAERLTSDGYYKTGDYGRFDDDGFLYLTGRVAEMIKTSTGRRISPAAIEAVYLRSPFIDQIVVFGNDRPSLVALIVPNMKAVEAALGHPPPSDMTGAVRNMIGSQLERFGQALSPYERVRGFAILDAPLSMANGDLTSNLKLRRRHIESRYAALIDAAYPSTVVSTAGS